MFDSKKIDAFFDGEKPFENQKSNDKVSISRSLRFIKLGFPCLAALLLGLMIVVPNIRKSAELQDITTLPHKDELEKLHVEDTVFYITDHKNRVSRLTAVNIDETAPGSQKVKLTNPKGDIAADNGNIAITAQTGFLDRNVNLMELLGDVRATLDDGSVVTTQSVSYEFDKDFGFGREQVHAVGDWGTLEADAFTYDRVQELLTLMGHNKIISTKGVLSARDKTEILRFENKVYAYGEASVRQENISVVADKIVGSFSENNHELQKAEAFGNVKIKTNNETAFGAEGVYDASSGKIDLYGASQTAKKDGRVEIHQNENVMYASRVEVYLAGDDLKQLKKANAYGGVYIKTPKGTAKGDRGVYNPQTNIVELFDNVIIEQDGNFIKGTHAETNLNTSVSRIRAGQSSGGRISGTFYKKKGK